MELTLAAARPLDFLEALDDAGERPSVRFRRVFALAAEQVAASTGVSLRTGDGELVLLAGLLPQDGDEAWLWFAPGPALRPRTLRALRGMRRLLELTCREIAPVRVKTFGAPGSVASPRLARLFGFTATGLLPSPAGPITVWTRRFE